MFDDVHHAAWHAAGNHEASCHTIGDILCPPNLNNFTAYNHRFRMPWRESKASGLNMWHSFNYGNAHFIMIGAGVHALFAHANTRPYLPLLLPPLLVVLPADTETDIGPYSPEGPDTLWHSGTPVCCACVWVCV